MIEYVNGQETTSTERDSPTFPGNVFYVHVCTNATDPQYWLFYKPVADYLMTTQVLKQRTRLDKVSIWTKPGGGRNIWWEPTAATHDENSELKWCDTTKACVSVSRKLKNYLP